MLTLLLGGELDLIFDARILSEYEEVLARPRFKLDRNDVAEVLRQLVAAGERCDAEPVEQQLPVPVTSRSSRLRWQAVPMQS